MAWTEVDEADRKQGRPAQQVSVTDSVGKLKGSWRVAEFLNSVESQQISRDWDLVTWPYEDWLMVPISISSPKGYLPKG